MKKYVSIEIVWVEGSTTLEQDQVTRLCYTADQGGNWILVPKEHVREAETALAQAIRDEKVVSYHRRE